MFSVHILRIRFAVYQTPGGRFPKISSNADNVTEYCYLSDGSKTGALDQSGAGLVYRGPFTYRRAADSSLTLESAVCPEGRLTPSGAMLHLTDHLGSVVAVVRGSDGALYEASEYDAYGKRSSLTSAGTVPVPEGVTLRDGFTGKEDQAPDFAVPYLDFGARQYSPSLRRWLVPDPMSEKYYGISPYAYCAGNPVNRVDPDGKGPVAGALIGAGLDVGIQVTTNLISGEKWNKNDKKSVLISAGAGAFGAGLVSKIKQVGNLAKMGKATVMAAEATTEAIVSGVESAAKQYASDGNVSVKETLTDVAIGGGGSLAGSAAKAVKRASEQGVEELKMLERQLDHAERVARGNNPRASRQSAVNKVKDKIEDYGNTEQDATNIIFDFGLSTLIGHYYYE